MGRTVNKRKRRKENQVYEEKYPLIEREEEKERKRKREKEDRESDIEPDE